jgi:hypothetical protein
MEGCEGVTDGRGRFEAEKVLNPPGPTIVGGTDWVETSFKEPYVRFIFRYMKKSGLQSLGIIPGDSNKIEEVIAREPKLAVSFPYEHSL